MEAATSHCFVFHDSRCGLCRRTMRTLASLDWLGRLQEIDIHDDETRKRVAPDLRPEDLDRSMHIRLPDGTTLTGFNAFRRLTHHLPLLWVLMPLLYLPGMAWIGERIYASVAARRKTCAHVRAASRDEACYTDGHA